MKLIFEKSLVRFLNFKTLTSLLYQFSDALIKFTVEILLNIPSLCSVHHIIVWSMNNIDRFNGSYCP
jgi:hypothetical protein